MTIVWEPPPLDQRNGIITSYMVKYAIANKLHQAVNVKSTRNVQVRLTNLKPFTNYSIEVAAATLKGYGPFSQPIIHQTDLPSKYLQPSVTNYTAFKATDSCFS